MTTTSNAQQNAQNAHRDTAGASLDMQDVPGRAGHIPFQDRWTLTMRGAALSLVGLGVAVLAGWALDVAALKSVLPGLSSMKVNTAAGFLLVGAALWQLSTGPRGRPGAIGTVCVAIIAMIAALTLAEYALEVDLGIDQAVFIDSARAPSSNPGRMSMVTAGCFLLFALGFATSGCAGKTGTAIFLGSTVGGQWLSFMTILGYIFGSEMLYSPVPGTSIAVHTAIAFFIAFIGLALARTDLGLVAVLRSRGPGGSFARWLVPLLFLGIPAVAWIRLQGERAGLYDTEAGLAIFTLVVIVVLASIVWRSGSQVDQLYSRLRNSERRYRQVVDEIHEAIWLHVDGKVVFANAYAAEVFGASSPAELIGCESLNLVHPDDQARSNARMSRFKTSAAPIAATEMKMQRLDGTPFDALVHAIAVVEDGVQMVLSTARDITELREAEAQLRQSQKMESIGRLTGGVSHDFNNLLTVIIGSADILAESEMSEKQRGHIDTIINTALRGAELTKQLLAFSRKQALQPMSVNANELLSGMETILTRTLGEDIQLAIERRDDLWMMLADRAQMESAILNLALNARHAMPNGGKLTIETANEQLDEDYAAHNSEVLQGDYVMLAVTDTGTGMTPLVIEKAFEPFFTTKAPGEGTGLGLSMIFGFIKQSRGHIKIYSEVGEGTTVKLYLPRDSSAAVAAAVPTEQAVTYSGSETILVVEDDKDVRVLAAENLRNFGYRVVEAANGPDAMTLLRQDDSIDLLFTDVILPGGMTGRNIADEALKFRPNLKVLYASGYTENAIIHHGRLDPGVNLLTKPYRRAELGRILREVLGKAG